MIGLPDILSVGPIDPPDPNLRRAWSNTVLLADIGLQDEPDDMESAWAEATAPGIAPVFWACLTSPMEHACYLAFAARMQDRPIDLVDATAFTASDGADRLCSLGMLRVPDIVASNPLAARRTLSSAERRAAATAWSALCRENAPFRIVQDGRMVSAPLTHYDALLIEQASPDWEIAAQLIGRAHTLLHFEAARCGQGNGGGVLFGRMRALGAEGALDITGPGPGIRDYRVRRAVA